MADRTGTPRSAAPVIIAPVAGRARTQFHRAGDPPKSPKPGKGRLILEVRAPIGYTISGVAASRAALGRRNQSEYSTGLGAIRRANGGQNRVCHGTQGYPGGLIRALEGHHRWTTHIGAHVDKVACPMASETIAGLGGHVAGHSLSRSSAACCHCSGCCSGVGQNPAGLPTRASRRRSAQPQQRLRYLCGRRGSCACPHRRGPADSLGKKCSRRVRRFCPGHSSLRIHRTRHGVQHRAATVGLSRGRVRGQ